MGRAYLKGGFTEQAEQELITTLQLNAKYIPALIKMGELHIQRKEYAQALQSYQELIRQNIKLPAVHFNAGLALLKMGQSDDAVPYLEKAVTQQPGVAYWHLTLARAYHKSLLPRKALKHYRASLQILPEQPEAHNEMGLVFWDLKSFYFADAALSRKLTSWINNMSTR